MKAEGQEPRQGTDGPPNQSLDTGMGGRWGERGEGQRTCLNRRWAEKVLLLGAVGSYVIRLRS